MAESALSDLTVLEFGNLVSAPYCTKLMADMGADVIKIEAPGLGDEARRREPFAGDIPSIERSGLFAYLNTSKRSITLDPAKAAGKKIFLELVKSVDILIENQPPALMEKLGLTYEILEKINPRLIMTSLTPFGQTGPYRDYKAHEINVYQGSGYGYISTNTYKEPVMPPVKAGGRQAQMGLGQLGAVTTMFAVLSRTQTGEGQYIDISNLELMAGLSESMITYWTFAGKEMGGLAKTMVEPLQPLQCKDGWVFLMCVEEFQFNSFVKVMGNPAWASQDIFKDRLARANNMDALMPLLTEWSMQHTKEEIFQMAQAARVPLAPAYSSEEIVQSRQLTERKYLVEIDHPIIGKARYPGAPYALSETPWRIARPAPLLGEHNQEIYCDKLGYDKRDFIQLAQAGVI